jgi:hypothetical protein
LFAWQAIDAENRISIDVGGHQMIAAAFSKRKSRLAY